MQQTNLCGTTFPLNRQSLYKLISTLKEFHFCEENFTEKGTTRWQFSPPLPPKRGSQERGYGVKNYHALHIPSNLLFE